jgi:hypothetical protein
MGEALCELVQPYAPAQRDLIRHSIATASRAGQSAIRKTPCRLPNRPLGAAGTVAEHNSELNLAKRSTTQPRLGH